MKRVRKVPKAVQRRAAARAAEEFFERSRTPPTLYQPLEPEQLAKPQPKTPPQLSEGATTVITDWQEGKALLKQLLAEGKIR